MATAPDAPNTDSLSFVNYHARACGKYVQLRSNFGCSVETAEEIRQRTEQLFRVRTTKTILEGEQYCFEFRFNNSVSMYKFNFHVAWLINQGWETPIISENPAFD